MSDPATVQLFQAMERSITRLDQRQSDHERQDAEERREANQQRDQLRAEMRDGFGELKSSISKLHERVNDVIAADHRGAGRFWAWMLSIAGGVILVLLGVIGWLIATSPPWLSMP